MKRAALVLVLVGCAVSHERPLERDAAVVDACVWRGRDRCCVWFERDSSVANEGAREDIVCRPRPRP